MAGSPLKRARREAAGTAPARVFHDESYIMKLQAERAKVPQRESIVKKVMVDVLGAKRYTRLCTLNSQEIDEIEQFVLASEMSDLKALMQSDRAPVYLKSLISAIFTDMKNGHSRTVDMLRDRQYGAISQKLELSGKDGMPITNVQMSADDARRLLEEINANC